MSLIRNEQTKGLANAFDRASTTCLTVGVITPIAGYFYNVSGFRSSSNFAALAFGLCAWLSTAVSLILWRG